MIAMIIGLSLVAVRVVGGPLRRMAPYVDLACLGAAFLLLETRAVTWSALLFGTTWVVNAIVFAAVLVVVLLAVEVTRRLPEKQARPAAFVFLAATLLVAWPVPTSWLLSLPVPVRVVAAVAIAFGPVFASDIVFATRFHTTEDGTRSAGPRGCSRSSRGRSRAGCSPTPATRSRRCSGGGGERRRGGSCSCSPGRRGHGRHLDLLRAARTHHRPHGQRLTPGHRSRWSISIHRSGCASSLHPTAR